MTIACVGNGRPAVAAGGAVGDGRLPERTSRKRGAPSPTKQTNNDFFAGLFGN